MAGFAMFVLRSGLGLIPVQLPPLHNPDGYSSLKYVLDGFMAPRNTTSLI